MGCCCDASMEKKHLASIKNFLASASVAGVEAEGCEQLKLLKQHDQSLPDMECEPNETFLTSHRYCRIYRRRKQPNTTEADDA